jgi:hypothetical protein
VVEGRFGFRFDHEPPNAIPLLGEISEEHLEGDAAVKGVFGKMDFAHAALAELFEQPVRAGFMLGP